MSVGCVFSSSKTHILINTFIIRRWLLSLICKCQCAPKSIGILKLIGMRYDMTIDNELQIVIIWMPKNEATFQSLIMN